MSAKEIESVVAAPALEAQQRSSATRDLLLADISIVQKQNITWLSRRFGFQNQIADLIHPRDDQALGIEPPVFNSLPTWKRWALLMRRVAIERDDEALRRIKAALGWRLMGKQRLGTALQPLPGVDSEAIDENTYAAWIARYDTLTEADRAVMTAGAPDLPDVTVLIRLDTASVGRVVAIAADLRAQLHAGWRAILVIPGTLSPADRALVDATVASDRRISALAASPTERLEGLVVMAEPHVVLRPQTLFAFAERARHTPDLRLIYADEDRMDPSGQRHEPAFKPIFSPELNRRIAYLGDCVCVTAQSLRSAPADATGVAEWAARLAATLEPRQVGHIPSILFHVRGDTPSAPRRATPAAPEPAEPASVAIIIPTRNHAALLSACVDSIWRVTDYPKAKLRVVLVDNGSDEPQALELLARLGRQDGMTVIPDPRPFNYARLNNVAAQAATEDVLVFLNNDTEITDPNWLRALAGWAMQPDVAVVGPKLLYPDRTVQHGGVILGLGGVAGHSFIGIPGDAPGYLGLASVTREVAALTGACIAVRRAVFEEAGGFDEQLEIAFNDTALCCEALRRGYHNLYVGEVSLLHYESKSRGFDDTPEKVTRFRQECLLVRDRYGHLFDQDPYYSPNMGLERQYQPAIPRAPRPWRGYRRALDRNPRVLILSDVHKIGHGVPVVAKEHAEYLAAAGWTVFVGGPLGGNEVTYERCLRVYLDGPLEAQSFAVEADVDCVIAHTIPYFSMFKTMSGFPRRVVFDHGEPPPSCFPDHRDRRDRENIDAEKQYCYRFAELVLTNTATVRDEIAYAPAEVAGLGNSHLATWDSAQALRRDAIRARLGLEGKFVILNVCRFHRAERTYKGIGDYVALKQRIVAEHPALAERLAFVLCGKGSEADRADMAAEGLTVFASVSDAELIELYIAADLYVNFSKWEGFNLGIAQALAMGLDAIASDIPAHRAFPIATSDDAAERVRLVVDAVPRLTARTERRAVLMDWTPLLEWLRLRLLTLCADVAGSGRQ